MRSKSTTPTPLATCTGLRVPRDIDAGWLEQSHYRLHDALDALARAVPDLDRATTRNALEATRGGDALVICYRHGSQTTARVVFPSVVSVTRDGNVTMTGFCSHRREVRAFRLDRVLDSHILAFPGDAAAEDGASEAWEDGLAGREVGMYG